MSTARIAFVARCDGLGDRSRVEVQRLRVDVGEHRCRALVEHAVRRGDEGERRGDDLVASARCRPGATHRCSPAVPLETAATNGALDAFCQRALEPVDHRPERQAPERSTSSDERLLALADVGLRERDGSRGQEPVTPRSVRARASERTSARGP